MFQKQFCSRTIESKQKRDRLNSLRRAQPTEDEDSWSLNDEATKKYLEHFNDNEGDDKFFFNPTNMVQKEFDLSEVYYFLTQGIKAIVDDDVTKRFAAEGKNFDHFMNPYFNHLLFYIQNCKPGIC